MIGASLALNISDIPFTDPVSSVNIGYCDGALVVNPTAAQREIRDTLSRHILRLILKRDLLKSVFLLHIRIFLMVHLAYKHVEWSGVYPKIII